MEYGIGTLNRFAFLEEGAEDATEPTPGQQLKGKENEKAPVAPAKKTTTPAIQTSKGNDKSSAQNQAGDKPRRDGPPRDRVIRPSNAPDYRERREGGQGGGFRERREGGEGGAFRERREGGEGGGGFRGERKDFEDRRNRRNRDGEEGGRPPLGQNNTGFSVERTGDDSGYRPRGDRPPRGRGGGFRGSRGGRGSYDGRGKREYDRHSGNDKTGVKPTEKREGSGSHNWGTVEDDMAAQINPEDAGEQRDRSADDNTLDQTANDNDNANESREPVEEEPQQLTLEEWRKLEAEKELKIPKIFNLRKPGEGENQNQWKKTYLLEKEKDEDESEYEEIIVEETVHGKKKNVLDIEINWDKRDDNRRGGGRGRGGPRGDRGGRGGYDRPRSDRPRDAADRDDRPPRSDRGGFDGERRGGYDRGNFDGERRGPREGGDRGGDRPGFDRPRGQRGGGQLRGKQAPKVDDLVAFPALDAA